MRDEGGKCGAEAWQIGDPDMKKEAGAQEALHAQRHSFVVGWELKEWLAAEQEWFARSHRT